MIYLMPVSWYWIKQRPQFLAKKLSEKIPLTVACLEDYGGKIIDNDSNGKITFVSFTRPDFIFFRSVINFWAKRFQLARHLRKYSIIWFTSPNQFLLAKPFIKPSQFVIYDCMDDILEFYPAGDTREALRKLENALCHRSDLVFATSVILKQRLIERYQIQTPLHVINNALNEVAAEQNNIELPEEINRLFADKRFKYLVYIGTISEWFNFEQVIAALDVHPAVKLIMVGPAECELRSHEQIIYTGRVDHSLVSPLMNKADALVMPFKLTDLVRAVNPVKAYEYIASGKPVLLTLYEETEQFGSFAYLFDSDNKLNEYLSMLSANILHPKRGSGDCKEFAQNNTWQNRAASITQLIDQYHRVP